MHRNNSVTELRRCYYYRLFSDNT